jgi:hypothetical protein
MASTLDLLKNLSVHEVDFVVVGCRRVGSHPGAHFRQAEWHRIATERAAGFPQQIHEGGCGRTRG